MESQIVPRRLHHHAFVVADQERTRHFYEDVLGMPLVATWCERENLRGKEREYCHTFFALADGSALAFFQFADADDYAELSGSMPTSLNHVALAVDADGQSELIGRLDGLTVEFTCDAANADEIDARRRADAHSELQRWLGGDRTPNNDLR